VSIDLPLPFTFRSFPCLQDARTRAALTSALPPVPAGNFGTMRSIIHSARHHAVDGQLIRETESFSHAMVEIVNGTGIYPINDQYPGLKQTITPLVEGLDEGCQCLRVMRSEDGPLQAYSDQVEEWYLGFPGGMLRLPILSKPDFATHLEDLQRGINRAPNSHVFYVDKGYCVECRLMEKDTRKEMINRIKPLASAFLPEGYDWTPVDMTPATVNA
jgi:hypothetical protein